MPNRDLKLNMSNTELHAKTAFSPDYSISIAQTKNLGGKHDPPLSSTCPSYLSTLYTEYISKQLLPSLAVAISTIHVISLKNNVKISQ